MTRELVVARIQCQKGTLEIWRAEHIPSRRAHHCAVCGAKIEGTYFAYKFKYAGGDLATLVVRACCDEHMCDLEVALAKLEETFEEDCKERIVDVWETINDIFYKHGIFIQHPLFA